MSAILRIAAASGILAAGLVFFALPSGASVPTGNTVPASLSARAAWEGTQPARPSCMKAVWPYVPGDCMARDARPVRTIAIERTNARSITPSFQP